MSFSSQSKAPTSLLSFLSDPWSPPQISYPSKTRFIFHLQGYQSTASQCHLQLACLCACSVAQLCPTFYDPMNCNPPGSSVHRILQAEILEWLSMPSSRGSSWSRDQTGVSCITSRFSAMEPTGRSPPTYMTIQIFPLTLGVVFFIDYIFFISFFKWFHFISLRDWVNINQVWINRPLRFSPWGMLKSVMRESVLLQTSTYSWQMSLRLSISGSC